MRLVLALGVMLFATAGPVRAPAADAADADPLVCEVAVQVVDAIAYDGDKFIVPDRGLSSPIAALSNGATWQQAAPAQDLTQKYQGVTQASNATECASVRADLDARHVLRGEAANQMRAHLMDDMRRDGAGQYHHAVVLVGMPVLANDGKAALVGVSVGRGPIQGSAYVAHFRLEDGKWRQVGRSVTDIG